MDAATKRLAEAMSNVNVEQQLLENIGCGEEIRFRLCSQGLHIIRTHEKDGRQLQLSKIFSLADCRTLRFTTPGQQLANTLLEMAIELRAVPCT